MKVDLFDFELERELIASKPVFPRDTSKLLDVTNEGQIYDRHFYDLPDILNEGDLLVFNNTKVIPARLYGKRGEAEVEVTLYHPDDGLTWWAFIKNCKNAGIACKKCEAACKWDAVFVIDNLASVDYRKCVGCGACKEACPTGCIASV